MKKVEGLWVDKNNNSWSCELHTKKQAEECSRYLINCSSCRNCRDCRDFKNNPQRLVSQNIGSRNSQTSVFLD